MQTGDVLDTIGGLSSQLKTYAAKLPAIVHLTVMGRDRTIGVSLMSTK